MRCAVFETFGEPADVIGCRDQAEPDLAAGEVLVRMQVAPVNPSDLMTIRGVYGKKPNLPATPGYEGVGVVEQANAGLFGSFLNGKRVAVLNREGGNWAEKVALPARQVVPLSPKLDLAQAATFFVNPATSYIMTQKILGLRSDRWLLQTAAASELGKMVIRLGKKFGFRTVNLVRREEQAETLRGLGADAVIVFDPESKSVEELQAEVKAVTGTDGVSAAIDPVGGATGSAVVNCLSAHGRMVVFGTLTNQPLTFSSRALMTRSSQIEGFWLSKYMVEQGLLAKLKLIRTITGLIQEGVLTSTIAAEYPLDQVVQAVRHAEQPGRGGKVLLRIGNA